MDAHQSKTSGRFLRRSLGVVLVLSAGIALPAAQATNTDGGDAGQVFVPIVPCRLLDTRGADHVGPRTTPLGPGDTYNQAVTGANGHCSLPTQASAVALNVTIVNPTADSFLTLWPAGAVQPLASNLNWLANAGATPNKVDVKLGADGRVNIFNHSGNVDVIADVVGYYADHNHDDRYYTKAQFDASIQAAIAQARDIVHHDTYNALAMHFVGQPNGYGTGVNNCIQPVSGVPQVSLIVPIGAKLISVEVDMLDGPTANPYQVFFEKYTANATGETEVPLVSITSGTSTASAVRVHHVLIPPTPEVIESSESVTLDFNMGSSSGNAFCGAILNYETVN